MRLERDWLDVAKIIRDEKMSEPQRHSLAVAIAKKVSSVNQFFNVKKFITVASSTLDEGWPNRVK